MFDFFILQWGKDFADNYNYGAQIQFLKNEFTSFNQPLMPPGITLKKWYSSTNFMETKNSPMLPKLKNRTEYHFRMNLDTGQKNSLQIKIECFDRFGTSLDTWYFNEMSGTFTYPERAASYTVELINIKNEDFLFKYLVIMEAILDEVYELEIDDTLSLIHFTEKETIESDDFQVLLQQSTFSTQGKYAHQKFDYEVAIQKGQKINIALGIEALNRSYSFIVDRNARDVFENHTSDIYERIKEQKPKNIFIRYGVNFHWVEEYFKEIPEKIRVLAESDGIEVMEKR